MAAKKKETSATVITVSITTKSLKDIIKKEDEGRSILRQNLFMFVKNGLKGKVYSPGDIINPVCLKLYKAKNLSQARTAKVDCLPELERLNNFVTSWLDFDKKGGFALRLTNKKVEALKKGKEDAKDNAKGNNQVVTFKKASLITLLDQFIDSDGATRAQKRVALELAELLEGDK